MLKLKNNRTMMKSICTELNHVKTRFIKHQQGKGIDDAANPIKTGMKVGQTISETLFPQTKQIFKDYYSGKIAKDTFNTKTSLFSKSFWNPSKKKIISNK